MGIAVAAAALVAFHLGDAGRATEALLIATVAANGLIGVVLGVLYVAHGFEFVMLGHAAAHLLVVVFG